MRTAGGYAYTKVLLQQSRYVLTLHKFTEELRLASGVEEVLWSVVDSAISELNLEDCVIYLFDDERRFLQQRAAFGAKASAIHTVINPKDVQPGVGIVGTVGMTGRPEIVNDTVCDNRYVVDDRARLSELAVPLLSQTGEVMGVIDSEHSKRGFFTFEHLRVLEVIARIAAVKIEIEQLKQGLQV